MVKYARGFCVFILSGEEASSLRLESDDDHGDLQISLLLQLGQHSCAEEDFTLSDPVQVGVQVQVLDLHRQKISEQKEAEVYIVL